MTFEHWLAFAAASAVLLAIPGPTILLIVSYALAHGRRVTAVTVPAVTLGYLTGITASMLGLGALLAASVAVFTAVQWICAAYLIYLGVQIWRTPIAHPAGAAAPQTEPRQIFLNTFWVTALNPKGVGFVVAILPRFLDHARPLAPQMVVYGATFLVIATLSALAYVWLAASARRLIQRPTVQRGVNRVGGGLLIGLGAMTAAWRGG